MQAETKKDSLIKLIIKYFIVFIMKQKKILPTKEKTAGT